MKLHHLLIMLTVFVLMFALIVQGTEQADSTCAFTLHNTSGATIWITNSEKLHEKSTKEELERNNARAIAPYDSKDIDKKSLFSIYTRVPQSNQEFERHYTIIQQECVSGSELDFNRIEQNKLPKSFIMIDHLKDYDIPEKEHFLCPGHKKPIWDTQEEQPFCKIHRYSDVYEEYVDEYVPVLTYMYQWLPNWIIGKWYTKHPEFYHWYDKHPDFWLDSYTPIWQTQWYADWYKNATESEKEFLKVPSEQTDIIKSGHTDCVGMPACKIKIEE